MFKGYELTIDKDLSMMLNQSGGNYSNTVETEFKDFLDKTIINESEHLKANVIKEKWFPEVSADIFLSHSHKDVELANNFAQFLDEKLGLKTFIDSQAWGYADELLKRIDKEYCYKKESNTYDYDKRNISTTHVHMILSMALTEMINKTECVMFLNTPNSIVLEDDMDITNSPWIYNELVITKLIKKHKPLRKRLIKAERQDSMDESVDKSLRVDYLAPLNHLINMDSDDIIKWKDIYKKVSSASSIHPLDILYNISDYNILRFESDINTFEVK